MVIAGGTMQPVRHQDTCQLSSVPWSSEETWASIADPAVPTSAAALAWWGSSTLALGRLQPQKQASLRTSPLWSQTLA